MSNEKSYIIRHKETKEQWATHSGKRVWNKPAHAKLAWAYSVDKHDCERYGLQLIEEASRWYKDKKYFRVPKFDEQSIFEIVVLTADLEQTLGEADALLQKCLGRITDYYLENEVKAYLERRGINAG